MIEHHNKLNRVINILMDYFVLNISLILTYNLIHDTLWQWMTDKTQLNVVIIFNLLWLLAANLIGLYNHKTDTGILIRSVKTYLLYLVLTAYILLAINPIESFYINKQYLLISMLIFAGILIAWKITFNKLIKDSPLMYGPLKRAIIVGGGNSGGHLVERLKVHFKGHEFLGIFDNNNTTLDQFLGNIEASFSFITDHHIDEVFCVLPLSSQKTIEKLIRHADKNMVRFRLIPEYYDYVQGKLAIRGLSGTDILPIRTEPLENIINRAVKRLFDIVFSSIVIVFILSWLYPILCFLIKRESPGPVLFVQKRSGRDNTTFNCYKFRSMHVNNDANTKQANRGDSRITKIGAFLRKTSLDEMPQFFNVFIGDMSVVGPRPHMLRHTEEYAGLIDHFMVRHFIKPGITGWAQVNGLRGETKLVSDMHARVDADMWYMENWSFRLDLKIIFSTFFNTIKGDKYAF